MMTEKKQEPDWAERARHIQHKPEWVDGIPHLLWELGDVFFPIPRRRKGWDYPHHLDDFRYCATSEILNAYLESGCGYGIACAGSLAVVDVDEMEYFDDISSRLPDTAWQISGSREGRHLFYKVKGLQSRKILRVPHPYKHKAAEGLHSYKGNSVHIGEIKCDPHGYVIGPGSVHPSGNTYGPLKGDTIAEVTKEELVDSLSAYIVDTDHKSERIRRVEKNMGEVDGTSKYEFYKLETEDVVPWLEAGKRVPHPSHGSETGSNFMKTDDGELFMCWRHDYGTGQGCALNPQQLLAVMSTGKDCDTVRSRWKGDKVMHYKAWREAVDRGLVKHSEIPYSVAQGYAIDEGMVEHGDDLYGGKYWDVINGLKCEVREQWLPERDSP